LEFAPWGADAHLGLYFWSISIEVVNGTQAVSLLTVVPELTGDGLDVELIPTGTLRHCRGLPCSSQDPNYFARVGDSEIYMVMVDTGGKAATVSVQAVIFEDIDHFQQAAIFNPNILDNSGLNVTFGFDVPSNTDTVRYIRVSCTVDFFGASEFVFKVQSGSSKTFLAQSRFEVQTVGSAASSLSAAFALASLMALSALLSF